MSDFTLGQGGNGASVSISGGTLNSNIGSFIVNNFGSSGTMSVSGSGYSIRPPGIFASPINTQTAAAPH